MSSRKKQRLSIRIEKEFAIVALEGMEIWDGADLALLREALTSLIEDDGYRAICVDLSAVKYIPSGFFGMLFEWYEQGLAIRLLSPQKNVENMLWFRMFFLNETDDIFRLSDDGVRNNTPNQQVEYHRREFMNGVDVEDEDEVEEHIKSVRFGVRSTERIG
jgi:anti-anti-sigma regulatory factor